MQSAAEILQKLRSGKAEDYFDAPGIAEQLQELAWLIERGQRRGLEFVRLDPRSKKFAALVKEHSREMAAINLLTEALHLREGDEHLPPPRSS